MTNSQSWTTYGLLVSQDPDKNDIRLFNRLNGINSFEIKDEWRIYESPETSTPIIVNLSDSKIKVGDTWLQRNEERVLSSGETITFNNQKSSQFEYVFVWLKDQKTNGERTRSEDVFSKDSPTVKQNKFAKMQDEDDVKEELTCSICQETLYNPVMIIPCNHRFCSGCLSENIEFSTKCPICREEITSFQKDILLNSVLNKLTRTFNSLQRAKEECDGFDEKDLISKGYQIIRNEDGVYFGEHLHGKKHGEGKMKYEGGLVYKGSWKDDKQEGRGIATTKSGNAYEGEWSNGFLKKTNVKITFTSGDVYFGEIEGPLMHGIGLLKFQNGDQYRGAFYRDKIEGQGAYNFQNGDRYSGTFVNGMKHGYGKKEYANGDVYEGYWKNDKKDGKGTFRYSHGFEFRGNWKNGESFGKRW